MKCVCGNKKMTSAGQLMRVSGKRQRWYCPVCGRTKTVPIPKPNQGRGVPIAPSKFTDEEE